MGLAEEGVSLAAGRLEGIAITIRVSVGFAPGKARVNAGPPFEGRPASWLLMGRRSRAGESE